MDSASLDHYEEQLYAVFKTFDVDNTEALSRSAVTALCDALQLEARGAALVDSLFETRNQRVTFAQFRSGLLAVLGAEPSTEPTAASKSEPARSETAPSDEDSSGREVAPKFVFGSKKYGRRSRPPRALSAPEDAPAEQPADRPRMRCSRSASVVEPRDSGSPSASNNSISPSLDYDSSINCDRALELCRQLRMDGIDRRLIERIFEGTQSGETTVGEFFDRLNASLSTNVASASNHPEVSDDVDDAALPGELVAETWERAGVQRPRRLLAELGFNGAALAAPELERALDDELLAFTDPPDARTLLLQAALSLGRLRHARSQRAAAALTAERDRLRNDVAESNRRARILAQEVDENHARLEAELTASLRRTEARHADAARAAEDNLAAERERAALERSALENEVARRAEAEARLRADATELRQRTEQLEARSAAAEARLAAAERERARLAADLMEAASCAGAAPVMPDTSLSTRLDEILSENKTLRDRCDELVGELEAQARCVAAVTDLPATGTSWREEAPEECESLPVSVAGPVEEMTTCPACGSPRPAIAHPVTADMVDSTTATSVQNDGETAELGAQLADAERRHEDEKNKLSNLVKELESSLEEMRAEYERCEEYWSGKLAEERELGAAEQRAGDERLSELAAKIQEYEKQFSRSLPPIDEKYSLELQVSDLEEEFAKYRCERERVLSEKDAEIARLRTALAAGVAETQEPIQNTPIECDEEMIWRAERKHGKRSPQQSAVAPTPERRMPAQSSRGMWPPTCGCGWWRGEGGALRARAARAEAAVARLNARLARADMLVKDLYIENCLLAPRGPLPRHL